MDLERLAQLERAERERLAAKEEAAARTRLLWQKEAELLRVAAGPARILLRTAGFILVRARVAVDGVEEGAHGDQVIGWRVSPDRRDILSLPPDAELYKEIYDDGYHYWSPMNDARLRDAEASEHLGKLLTRTLVDRGLSWSHLPPGRLAWTTADQRFIATARRVSKPSDPPP